MCHSLEDYLAHIQLETSFILEVSKGLEKQTFVKNPTLTRAIVRSLEIIGEATKKLPDDFRQRHSQIPWKQMAGMRDKLIHQYFGVDYDLVWNVVISQIPGLDQQIQLILSTKTY
ncbi:DUF86 domain-containing protein [Cyanobacterium aponinum]|uniref:HepT-like ribonuclease domain-containing protein n=1 Tax=Cyanobacterium aponinum TaxID=379064 RepID=UPI000C12BAAF|nr:DUF86 domain-containing protein [Cyanobacterium aponinum]PHV63607.1 hypothetical protein CSQ80_04570 [Cyanobacterium aponinum IPPAS B-1201]